MTRLSVFLLLFVSAGFPIASGCASETELVWNEESGYRWADLSDFSGTGAGFEEVSPRTSGIDFVNILREASFVRNRHYLNGSGVAVGDVDGDGWTDLYFARLDSSNALYRNLGGWKFEDITVEAGVAAPDRYSTGAVFADIDGDGDLDLLVTAMGGPNAAFVNDGQGHFTEMTDEAGLTSHMGSTSMALSDVDGDGDVDLYVSNYKTRAVNDIHPPWEHSFERTVLRDGDAFRIAPEFEEHYELQTHAGGLLRVERAEPNLFYLNDGAGRFTSVPLAGGAFIDDKGEPLVETPEDWTLTVRFQDVNGDGAPDLYVCNDFQSPDYFFLGDGKGRFKAVSPLALRKTSFSTMSVDFSDVDRDGNLDFFLTDMLSPDYVRRQSQVGLTIPMTTAVGEIENRPQAVQNMLLLNRGDDTYAEIGRLSGVAASDWTWSGLFLDVDLDGYEDLLLATGHLFDVLDKDAQMADAMAQGTTRDAEAMRRKILDYPPLPLANVAFRNRGDLGFDRQADGWGLGSEPDVSNALAFGDFDNDGDLDAVVNRLNDSAGLFRNISDAPRLAVRLRGISPNTQAVGSKIRVIGEGMPVQEKEVIIGGQYLSGSDPLYTFAAASDEHPMTIEVSWRNGQTSRIDSVPPNRIVEIDEPGRGPATNVTADVKAAAADSTPRTLFEDVSQQIDHRHVEAPFDDFSRQPLLAKRLGQQGPGAAWADIDGDGDDDLLLGTGRGGSADAYLNDGGGGFSSTRLLDAPAKDDATGVVSLQLYDGGALVFVGVANYEQETADSSWIDIVEISSSGQASPAGRLPFGRSSVGHLVLADIDGDGDLDLFAGGRLVPARYPAPASSRIYLNDNGSFRFEPALSEPFHQIGMVSGAAFGDLDQDGDVDVVLAIEWGPIRYFQNEGGGRFVDRSDRTGFSAFTGLWNGVALGDFDTDGRMDVIATNWGWNGIHERLHAADRPVRLYYDDFDADGTYDVVESVYEPGLNAYVPLHGLTELSQGMSYVSQRIRSFRQYATAPLNKILGPKVDRAPYLEANTLTSMLFLNRSGSGAAMRFDATPLPLEAQFSPAFAAVVADFNADGQEDVFVSQNFFALPMDIPRQDAGRGLLLQGDGQGNFAPIAGQHSGIAAYGEQRGGAASDFDSDGRTDLVVTQNGAQTRLYRNVGDTAGLRIELVGTEGNPLAIGATLRLRYADGTQGAARIVSAGSGYWSQSGAVQVMGLAPDRMATSVQVTWPDGHVSETPISHETRTISISHEDVN